MALNSICSIVFTYREDCVRVMGNGLDELWLGAVTERSAVRFNVDPVLRGSSVGSSPRICSTMPRRSTAGEGGVEANPCFPSSPQPKSVDASAPTEINALRPLAGLDLRFLFPDFCCITTHPYPVPVH
jgi:hypothetical protein